MPLISSFQKARNKFNLLRLASSSGLLDGKPGGAPRKSALGIFGYFYEVGRTSVQPYAARGLTSGLPSWQPRGASFVLGGEVVAWSLPNSGPAIPRWRESKVVAQSIKQSFLAEGVHLSITFSASNLLI